MTNKSISFPSSSISSYIISMMTFAFFVPYHLFSSYKLSHWNYSKIGDTQNFITFALLLCVFIKILLFYFFVSFILYIPNIYSVTKFQYIYIIFTLIRLLSYARAYVINIQSCIIIFFLNVRIKINSMNKKELMMMMILEYYTSDACVLRSVEKREMFNWNIIWTYSSRDVLRSFSTLVRKSFLWQGWKSQNKGALWFYCWYFSFLKNKNIWCKNVIKKILNDAI